MGLSRRVLILGTTSITLLLLIALSLVTAIQVARPTQTLFQFPVAHFVRVGNVGSVVGAKASVNDTDRDNALKDFNMALVDMATATKTTELQEGMIGMTPTPQPSADPNAEGMIGSVAIPLSSAKPMPKPAAPKPVAPKPATQDSQIPIMALSYSGSGGPKHCRGEVLQRMNFPRPIQQWKNGTCINLPAEARCGIFFSAKGDNCQADLFNMPDCFNTTSTYVNTVVFMPEERPVGALWRSMKVRCAVEVPEAKMIDPSILGDALKKPGGG